MSTDSSARNPAVSLSPMLSAQAHGWRLGRVVDPFGHHWEIGCPLAS